MKIFTKLSIGLAAMIMTISPLATSTANLQSVQAKTQEQTIVLTHPAYLYNKNGHKVKEKIDKNNMVLNPPDADTTTDPNGYYHLENYDVTNFPYTGKTRIINGQTYYDTGKNYYVNAADVKEINGKNIKQSKLVLNHKSAVYNKKGQKVGQTYAKNSIINYAGKVKTTTEMPKYFFSQAETKTYSYLTTHQIKGHDYYALGHNRYLNAYNVDSINGEPTRYNGVTTAKVISDTKTQTLTNARTKHILKKGQKIKLDLTVTPWSEDFGGYIYRLHDYPNEYVNEFYVQPRASLPVTDYTNLAYSFVKPNTTNNVQIYDVNGKATDSSIKYHQDATISVDGLIYLWNASEKKAELFYHLFYDHNDTSSDTVNPADKPNIPTNSNPNTVIATPVSTQQPTAADPNLTNRFIKASDVTFTNGIKLTPINTAKEVTDEAQKPITDSTKKELQDLIAQSQTIKNSDAYHSVVRYNYDNALTYASNLLKSNKATVAQAKEAIWLLKTTQTQLTTLDFEDWS
ncbi:SLAP domain-containing protein [Lactobacillus sp. ESL0681]|uniref:SLAP domain-containing protein n=1 Tax=Lactobacillus sp. ESL0681 TaxID=2983211 RepID=UPI0023F63148|nr:SLAP domain-containing protein [Lactobacillus sp. ESL0681]WEV39717.1 SLAP domain-containing protein [Lactobacillus sp. ESL0681]